MARVLLVIGDAAEVLDTMYPLFRLREEGYEVHVAGPAGSLPLTPEFLRTRPSGDVFGWTQNAGMGWEPSKIGGTEFLILSTHGGIRAPDGTPVALGYHTGHWEVGLLMEAAAREIKSAGGELKIFSKASLEELNVDLEKVSEVRPRGLQPCGRAGRRSDLMQRSRRGLKAGRSAP